MDKFLIDGPSKIKGKVSISGSKNASLPILAATLLFDLPVTIQNLPRVKDINTMLNLLKSLGSKIELSKDKKTAKISNNKNMKTFASYSLVKTVEYFRIPKDVLCICVGKSTYARTGIICNVTPIENEFEGNIVIELSNTTPNPAKIYSNEGIAQFLFFKSGTCLLYTSPSPRDLSTSRMPSSA